MVEWNTGPPNDSGNDPIGDTPILSLNHEYGRKGNLYHFLNFCGPTLSISEEDLGVAPARFSNARSQQPSLFPQQHHLCHQRRLKPSHPLLQPQAAL